MTTRAAPVFFFFGVTLIEAWIKIFTFRQPYLHQVEDKKIEK